MALQFRLSVGDGDVTDDLDLADASKHRIIGELIWQQPRPGSRWSVLAFQLGIYGATTDAMIGNERNIQRKLEQARAAAGPYGHGTRVTASIKLDNATSYVYADVVDGYVDPVRVRNAGQQWMIVNVELLCEPYLRGDAVTTTVSGTITNTTGAYATPGNSGAGGLFIADVPGDVPALARYVLTDTTGSSKYINRLRIASMWMPDVTGSAIAHSDYQNWIDDTPAGAGSATSDATAIGSAGSRITLGTAWQRAASYASPSASYARGLFDVYVRAKDSNAVLGAPTLTALAVGNDANMYVRQTIQVESTGATSFTPTWGTETRAGSTLLMGAAIKSRTITFTTPTDWTAGSAPATHGSDDARVAWFYIEVSAARSGAETLTVSSSVAGTVVMYEIVGAAYTSPIDRQVANTGTTTTLSVASGALAQAREMIFGIGQSADEAAWAGTPLTTGFTDLATVYADDTQDAAYGYARSTATTTQNMTFNVTPPRAQAAAIISVKQAPNLAPNIPTGTYEVCVVAASTGGASLSPASNVAAVTVTQTDCVIAAEWDIGTGSPDHHRLYYRPVGGTWEYYAQPASSGSYTAYIIAADGGTAGDPPTFNSNAASVRLGVALSSGTTIYYTQPVQTTLGASQWELLYLGTVPLPPMPAIDGGSPRSWIAYAQAKHAAPSGTIDFDALILVPHQWPNSSYVEAEYTGLTLAALRAWKIETRRDGYTFGYLAQTGGDTEAGQLDVIGDCYLGPGDTWVTVLADIGSGVHDIVDTDYTLSVTYTPRFTYLRGS